MFTAFLISTNLSESIARHIENFDFRNFQSEKNHFFTVSFATLIWVFLKNNKIGGREILGAPFP